MSAELEELKKAFDRARLEQFAEEEGLPVRSHRMPCPAECANDKRRASLSEEGGVGLWNCHGCGSAGTAIDLLMYRRKVDTSEAIRILKDLSGRLPPLRPRPEQPKKNGSALWEKLARRDRVGEEYLKSRGLEGAVDAGLVRFSVGLSGDSWLDGKGRQGYRVALPLKNAAGELVSFQMRAVGSVQPSKLSLFTISTEGLAFGQTAEARTSPRVFITEGFADTLTLLLTGECTVGADGEGKLRWMPSFLGHVKGREFVLCPQNDTHEKSQKAFEALGRTLKKDGAIVRVLSTPPRYKDPAEWLAADGIDAVKAAIAETLARPAAPANEPVPTTASPTTPANDDDDGLPTLTNSYASACEVFRNPHIRSIVLGDGEFEYNELTLTPTIGRQPLREEQLSRVRELVERNFRDQQHRPVKLVKGDIEQAALQVAKERSFHPVAEYLTSLEWDGVPRIARLASDVLGIDTSSKGQPLATVQLRKWMIAAVARALKPGCKVDTVLVLAGPQGIYKSTFFRVLAGADWFSDAPVDMHDKDSRLLLRRCWILEFAELDSLQRAKSATSVKAFITSQVDQVRPPYARAVADFPRTCIIVGTTNQDAFLADSTGSRRYWVIELDRKVNLPLLTAWRDHLWAEAVAAFHAGEHWHLGSDEERALAAANQAYEQTDPWEELVLEHAEKRHAIHVVTVEDLLRNAIGKDPKDWSGRDKNRVVDILKRAGWKQDGRKRCEDGTRVRRWEPPRPTTSAA